jgi:hypothetical protein
MKPLLIPVLGALLLLAGCGAQRIILCPGAAILADTATAPVVRPGMPLDLSNVAFTASVTDVKTSCTFDRLAGETFSDIDIDFRATRAPNANAARLTMDYFITVNAGERILSKRMETVTFDFAPGATVSTVQLSPDRVVLELERGHLPTDYQMLIGFQMTPDLLAFSRKMSPFAP